MDPFILDSSHSVGAFALSPGPFVPVNAVAQGPLLSATIDLSPATAEGSPLAVFKNQDNRLTVSVITHSQSGVMVVPESVRFRLLSVTPASDVIIPSTLLTRSQENYVADIGGDVDYRDHASVVLELRIALTNQSTAKWLFPVEVKDES